jgi:hypothetical protein
MASSTWIILRSAASDNYFHIWIITFGFANRLLCLALGLFSDGAGIEYYYII